MIKVPSLSKVSGIGANEARQTLVTRADLDAVSGGLQSVAHDDTLAGDGTASSPLSVIGGGGTMNYNALTNRPTINSVVLQGNKSLDELSGDITYNSLSI